MPEEGYLVIYTYKGHQNQIVLPTENIREQMDQRKIRGVIDEIYPPGEWHTDPETDCPVPD